MQRLFSGFPSGLPGAGLLLLRSGLGLHLIVHGANITASVTGSAALWGAVLVVMGALALVGAVSPAVQLLITGLELVGLVEPWPGLHTFIVIPDLPPLAAITIALSLVLLGPGAYSVDAYLFGRKEIRIPRRRALTTADGDHTS